MNAPAKAPPTSPCIGVCAIDERRGLCTGCARTIDEIVGWGGADDAFRARVWAELPARAAALGLTVRRLDRGPDAILAHVARSFEEAAGTWVAGVPGAVGEALRAPGEPVEIARDGPFLTVATPRAALRLAAPRWLTALEIARPDGPSLIALAVPAGRVGRAGPAALTDLGRDTAPLLPRDAGGRLHDLGLGRAAVRFAVRLGDELAAGLAPVCGTPFPDHLARIAGPLLAESPVRVIETPCLRMEIDAPIPPPGGASPAGPHTHLLPDHLAAGQDAPPGLGLPEGHALSALFYPAP